MNSSLSMKSGQSSSSKSSSKSKNLSYLAALLLVLKFCISERSEPPSDKLGGEIFISLLALVCLFPLLGE